MSHSKKIGLGLLLCLLLAAIFSQIVTPLVSAAEPSKSVASDYGLTISGGKVKWSADDFTLRWIDAATIEISPVSNPDIKLLAKPENESGGNAPLQDQRGRDADQKDYIINGFECGGKVMFDDKKSHEQVTSVKFSMKFRETSISDCKSGDPSEIKNYPIGNPELSTAYFRWVDAGTIERVDGEGPGRFIVSEDFSNVFLRETEAGQGGCQDRLVLSGDKSSVKLYELDGKYGGNTPSEAQTSCNYNKSGFPQNDTAYLLVGTENLSIPAGEGSSLSPTLGGSSGSADSCESMGDWSWAMCPIINMLDGALTFVDNQIQSLLEIDKNKYTSENLRSAWEIIRNIAYTILIPIMLVMVIGTALGMEVFSAYTVKKALPRMVIAVIFITFSWYITGFLINLFNVLGAGILGIMTTPFPEAGDMSLATLFDPTSIGGVVGAAAQWGGIGLVTTAVVVAAGPGGLGGHLLALLLLFLAGALLIFALVLLVLLARQMFIVALLLIAPLAILAWIFPGNDKLWKIWWNSFTKLLMMFPLIMGIIAVGRIFAHIIGTVGDSTPLDPFLKLGAYVIPYIAIPYTFKFAGGVFANLAGIVNNKEKGLFDRLRGARSAVAKDAHAGIMSGKNRFSGTKLGGAYQRAARFGRDGSFSLTQRGRERWQQTNQAGLTEAEMEAAKKDGGRALGNDTAIWAASAATDAEDYRRRYILQKHKEEYRRALKFGMSEADARAHADGMLNDATTRTKWNTEANTSLAALEANTGLQIGSASMKRVAFRSIGTSNTAIGDDVESREEFQQLGYDLIQQGLMTSTDAASVLKSNRGRSDLSAPGFLDQMKLFQKSLNPDTGQWEFETSAEQHIKLAFEGADSREGMISHTNTSKVFSEQAVKNLNEGLASGDQKAIDDAVSDIISYYDSLRQASPKKAKEWADKLGQVVTYRTTDENGNAVETEVSVREVLDKRRKAAAGPDGTQRVLDRGKEYGLNEEEARLRGGQPPEPEE